MWFWLPFDLTPVRKWYHIISASRHLVFWGEQTKGETLGGTRNLPVWLAARARITVLKPIILR
jgi:hypothetical protein